MPDMGITVDVIRNIHASAGQHLGMVMKTEELQLKGKQWNG